MAFETVKASGAISDATVDLDDWRSEVLSLIAEAREMLDHWLKELAHYIEGPGTQAQGREKKICERTRMVLVAGEQLDVYTRMLTRWAEAEAPPEKIWDAETMARAEQLLQLAVRDTTSHYRKNCQGRLDYFLTVKSQWCPRATG